MDTKDAQKNNLYKGVGENVPIFFIQLRGGFETKVAMQNIYFLHNLDTLNCIVLCCEMFNSRSLKTIIKICV